MTACPDLTKVGATRGAALVGHPCDNVFAGILKGTGRSSWRRVWSDETVSRTSLQAHQAGGRRTANSSRSIFWFAFFTLAALSTLWSLASPIFSVPDENAHATKAIAQVNGQVIGYHVPGVKHTVVDLPEGYSYAPHILCFAYHPNQPANCGVELGDASGTDWFNTWVGAYNPLYYYAVGWPSLILDGAAGIYGMRIVSGLLAAVFVAWGFQAAMSVRRSRWMPLGLAFVAAPMVVYFFGSVNPNGIEIASAVALWTALPRLLEQFDSRKMVGDVWVLPRWYLWMIVAIASVTLATARATGPLWLIVVVGICFIATGWKPVKALFTTGRAYIPLGFVAAGGIFSIVWTLSGGSLSSQADKSDAPLVGASFMQGFVHVLRTTPGFIQQAIGYFGWFDAPLPTTAYWLFVIPLGTLIILAFTASRRRGLITVAVMVAAAIFVPALVQGYSVSQTGIIWQGRYGLFLYLGITILAAWVLCAKDGDRAAFLSTRLTWIGAAMIASYGLLAFVAVMWRYVVGSAAPISEMWKNPAWQPPLGWPTLVALYALVSIVFVVWTGWLAGRAARLDDAGDSTVSGTAADSSPERVLRG
ncbi:Predicted membrane protein [Cryobacterium luteum]|uniref:DUF2142 domain-containing protein n=1 Tax=Cryobacterium luteum TaxID=1424661 RepID=A0A1H8KQA3_9MICO|nr:DUF2142 domain-containing protein [Cryobacterium luteum]SEN94991.1 Predicted membrane protein [Cryobacterium luteum]